MGFFKKHPLLSGFLGFVLLGLILPKSQPDQPQPTSKGQSSPAEPRVSQQTLTAPPEQPVVRLRGIEGLVVAIADGDTLTLLDDAKTQHKIRLHGIDTPETGQPFGDKAKEALANKVFQKRIRAVKTDQDRYRRTVAEIYLDDRHVNKELVEEGWAWHYRQYSDSDELAEAETAARSAKRGLWSDKTPIAPWDWRRGTRDSRPDVAATTTDHGAKGGPEPAKPTPSTKPSAKINSEAKNEDHAFAYAKQVLLGIAEKLTTVKRIATVVYVTDTGEKYHAGGCQYLRKSKIPISLDVAQRSYSACSVCGGGGAGGGVEKRTPKLWMEEKNGLFDEKFQEWLFAAKLDAEIVEITVFYARDGRWRTRFLQIGDEVVHTDKSTPGFGAEWGNREAAAMLSQADEHLSHGRASMGATYLRELLEKYPTSPSAGKANEMLDKLTKDDPSLAAKSNVSPEVERKALAKLRLAEKLLERDRAKGEEWLREVIEDFPLSQAAVEAEKLLRVQN